MNYVYLIEMVGTPYVKVGVSLNPEARCVDLQVSSPFLLRVREKASYYRDAYEVEAEVHETLKARHMRGEWFHWPDGWTLEDAVNGPVVRASTLEWLARYRPRFEVASEKLAKRKVLLDRWIANAARPREEMSRERLISSVLDRFRCTELPQQSPHLQVVP